MVQKKMTDDWVRPKTTVKAQSGYTIKYTRATTKKELEDLLRYDNGRKQKVYPTLDKARAGARRKVCFGFGFHECGVYKDGSLVGWVVGSADYGPPGYPGIFWVPKGKDVDGYWANGVTREGTLSKTQYKLT